MSIVIIYHKVLLLHVFVFVLHHFADTLMPYSCTGNFQTDFVELCRRVDPPFIYTPDVVVRPHRPPSPTLMPVIEEKTTATTTRTSKIIRREDKRQSGVDQDKRQSGVEQDKRQSGVDQNKRQSGVDQDRTESPTSVEQEGCILCAVVATRGIYFFGHTTQALFQLS